MIKLIIVYLAFFASVSFGHHETMNPAVNYTGDPSKPSNTIYLTDRRIKMDSEDLAIMRTVFPSKGNYPKITQFNDINGLLGVFIRRDLESEIKIAPGLTEEKYKYVLRHELGHFIWYEILSNREKVLYKHAKTSTNYYPTEYSRQSLTEHFAEMVAGVYSGEIRVDSPLKRRVRGYIRTFTENYSQAPKTNIKY